MSQFKRGRDLLEKVKAPEGKTIVAVDTSNIDTLAFDAQSLRMGISVDGKCGDGKTLIFGEHFAIVQPLSTQDFHYLVMKDENIHAILEA